MKKVSVWLAMSILIGCIACGSTKPRIPILTVERKLAIREAQLRVQTIKPVWDAAITNFERVKKESAPDGWVVTEDANGELVLVVEKQRPERKTGK